MGKTRTAINLADGAPNGQRTAMGSQLTVFIDNLKEVTGRLNDIWDKIGLSEETRAEQISKAFHTLQDILMDTVAAEEEKAITVERDIEARRYMVKEMRAGFNLPAFDETPYSARPIALLTGLDHDLATLAEQKDRAMSTQLRLHERIKMLCERLDLKMPPFEEIHNKIYDEAQLEKMRSLIPELCTSLRKRVSFMQKLQEESLKIYEALSPNVNITPEELALLQMDFNNEKTVVSEDSFEKTKALNQKLKDQYDAWLEGVACRYEELLAKMEDLSKKTRLPATATAITAKRLDYDRDGVLNARELQRMEEEVQQMEERYERSGPVFSKLNQWLELWREKLDSEKRVCRVSFYKNRAGSTRNAVRRQKEVDLLLPKTHNELKTLVDAYTEEYGEEDILVEGVLPHIYVASLMQAYKDEKEVQRVQKRFGTRQNYNPSIASPARQKLVNGNLPTPMVKLQQVPMHTPATGTTKRKARRSRSFTSEVSDIQPVGMPFDGPRTSSPRPSHDGEEIAVPTKKLVLPSMPPVSRSKPPSAMKATPQSTPRYGRTPQKQRWVY